MSTFERDFLEDARNLAYDKIDELDDGYSFYGSDLSGLLMEYDWSNNSLTFSAQEARDYIAEHPLAAAETQDYLNEISSPINVFDDPEPFHIAMFELGVDQVLGQCPMIQDAWNDEIVIDYETKTRLLSEIENADLAAIG